MRWNIDSSRLVRLLSGWAPLDAHAPGMDIAERLGLWVSAFDAIGLQAAQQSIMTLTRAAPASPPRPVQACAKSVAEDLVRVRTTLAHLIAKEADSLTADDTSYALYHQLHLRLQREMEQAIASLRDRVRQTLSRISPRLRQLAALDAVLEQVIAPREQALLPTTSTLMARRYEQLRATEGGLDGFANEWRQALLSELDLRLEPVTGLVDALRNEPMNPQ
ncbi:DUF3348 family protein [Ramlibacter sp. WS9]|uniref:DUF3348 family protein n=1 Tax=Ramlibacter sp. WS9 TaxID=1882741 RepID=UPI00130548F7|nr:DUF3348 family protein [Ramlibacter sp. WS9]